jgi:two-component system cell cycle sensor histidine kinase/response regulator CckA
LTIQNSSDRERAEKSLRESEERFRRVITQTKAGYFLIDRAGRFVQVNDAWLGMHGYESAEEVIGRHFSLTQVEGDLPASREIVETMLAGGPVPDGEFSHRCRDGSIGYHTFTLSPVFEQGEVVGLEGFLIDTTGLKRAEADHQTLFREMLDGCALHEIVCDEQGAPVDYRFLAVNPAFENMTGLKANDIVGHNVLEVLPGTERHWIQTYGKVALTGVPVFFESYHAPLGKHFQVTAFQPALHQFACIFTDITERMKAEERLRLTQISVDSALDMIAWIGADGRLLYVNDAFCSGHGYSQEELLGMTIFDLDLEMSAEAWPDQWRRDRERGAATFEVTHRTKGGEIFPLEVVSYFVERDGEEINVGFARDVAERKRAEEALLQEKIFTDKLLNAPRDTVFLFDPATGKPIRWNQRFSEVCGFSDEEIAGMTAPDDFYGEDDLEKAKTLIGKILAEGQGVVELSLVTKTGTRIPFEYAASMVETTDGKSLFLSIGRDITEREQAERALRESEEKFRSSFMTGLDAFYIATLEEGRFVEANAVFEDVFGYSREEALSKTSLELGLYDDPADREKMVSALKAQGFVRDLELKGRKKGGETVVTSLSASILVVDGKPHILGVIRDITERQRAEEALRQAEDQLRQSQKMEAVGQLAGGIAHDFNNLLTAVLGYSDLVLASPELTGSAARGDVEQIKHAAERAAALTRQILAFSRRQALTPAVVSLNDILAGMEPLLRRTLGEDIDLVGLQHPHLGHVEVDVHQFEQVLMNLALNARDAMPQGGRLTVETGNIELDEEYCRTHPDATPGKYVMLSVSDTGVGMDENTMAHMFEPFFTTKAPGEGTGLGLSTVYGIVKQSGGSVFVCSEPGKGTKFKLYLPQTASPVEKEVPASTVEVSQEGNETVLVVEDEVPVRKLVERVLGGLGYRVLSAGTADEAVRIAKEVDGRLDLLLTDLTLPAGMQGNELAGEFLIAMPDLPVIFMSGYARGSIAHTGGLDGRANLLEKPFAPENLARMVRMALDVQRGAQDHTRASETSGGRAPRPDPRPLSASRRRVRRCPR